MKTTFQVYIFTRLPLDSKLKDTFLKLLNRLYNGNVTKITNYDIMINDIVGYNFIKSIITEFVKEKSHIILH